MLLCGGCVLAVIAGLGLKHAPVSAAVAYFAVVGLVAIWMLYRICCMGVRFDDYGVTVRKFFRISRFNWPEVSHFADGVIVMSQAGTSLGLWALQIVLRDGRSVIPGGTAKLPMWRSKEQRKEPAVPATPEVLAKICQVAARYHIPAQLTGKPLHTTAGPNAGHRP
jgi:hypothetical protein